MEKPRRSGAPTVGGLVRDAAGGVQLDPQAEDARRRRPEVLDLRPPPARRLAQDARSALAEPDVLSLQNAPHMQRHVQSVRVGRHVQRSLRQELPVLLDAHQVLQLAFQAQRLAVLAVWQLRSVVLRVAPEASVDPPLHQLPLRRLFPFIVVVCDFGVLPIGGGVADAAATEHDDALEPRPRQLRQHDLVPAQLGPADSASRPESDTVETRRIYLTTQHRPERDRFHRAELLVDVLELVGHVVPNHLLGRRRQEGIDRFREDFGRSYALQRLLQLSRGRPVAQTDHPSELAEMGPLGIPLLRAPASNRDMQGTSPPW